MALNENEEPETGSNQPVEILPSSHRSSTESDSEYRMSDGPTEDRSLLAPNMQERPGNELNTTTQKRSLFIDLLVIFFGTGTWICVNGTFLQLPLLVDTAPERWSLPSHLSICVQLATLGPITYSLLQKLTGDRINESIAIYTLLTTETISVFLAAFFYNRTAVMLGTEYSLALYVFMFCFALTACTSSVLFMPYMGRFKEIYLVTYLSGEGLSGLLPSIVALIQGVGSTECVQVQTEAGPIWKKVTPPARFGTRAFYLICFGFMLCSFTAFLLLDRLKMAKKHYANVTVGMGNRYTYKKDDHASGPSEELRQITPTQYKMTLFLMGMIGFIANGMFSSIQSYSTMPYGNEAYHFTTTMSLICDPFACFLAIFLPHTCLKSILRLIFVAVLCTIYVFTTAIMSPNPFLMDSPLGEIFVVLVWTLLIGIISFVKLSITSVMRAQGGKSLVWTGTVSLIGSATGSILIFVVINYTNSFKSFEDKCG